jgi:hypothetical protein
MPGHTDRLITGMDIREYFHDAVAGALEHRRFAVQDETLVYVANLLVTFARVECLFDTTAEGLMQRPLAQLYGEAAAAGTVGERDKRLRRLGDIALFIAGLFAHSLSRSLVDIDYYIAMGGGAYGRLAASPGAAGNRRTLQQVYTELAGHFPEIVDVLAEVGDRAQLGGSADVLRLYEIWLCSGSRRALARLRELGIDPVPGRRSTH